MTFTLWKRKLTSKLFGNSFHTLGSLSSSKHELDVQEIQAVDADLAAAAAEERSQLVDGAKEGEQEIGTSKWYY